MSCSTRLFQQNFLLRILMFHNSLSTPLFRYFIVSDCNQRSHYICPIIVAWWRNLRIITCNRFLQTHIKNIIITITEKWSKLIYRTHQNWKLNKKLRSSFRKKEIIVIKISAISKFLINCIRLQSVSFERIKNYTAKS